MEALNSWLSAIQPHWEARLWKAKMRVQRVWQRSRRNIGIVARMAPRQKPSPDGSAEFVGWRLSLRDKRYLIENKLSVKETRPWPGRGLLRAASQHWGPNQLWGPGLSLSLAPSAPQGSLAFLWLTQEATEDNTCSSLDTMAFHCRHSPDSVDCQVWRRGCTDPETERCEVWGGGQGRRGEEWGRGGVQSCRLIWGQSWCAETVKTSASITIKRDFSHLTHKFKLSLIRHSSVFIYIWRERVETSNLKTESRQTVKWPLILAATQRQNDLPVCFSLSATKEIHKRIQVCTSVVIKKIWKISVAAVTTGLECPVYILEHAQLALFPHRQCLRSQVLGSSQMSTEWSVWTCRHGWMTIFMSRIPKQTSVNTCRKFEYALKYWRHNKSLI